MKFINFAVVKFSLFLILGIVVAYFFPIFNFLFILLFCLTLLVITWIFARNQLVQSVFFGIVTYATFFSVGYFNYQIRLPKFQKSHYSYFISEEKEEILQIKIVEVLKPDNYNTKYIAEVFAIKNLKTQGKILVNIKKDSLDKNFTIDDILIVSGSIKQIPSPLNPHQFDYKKYMQTLGVYFESQIDKSEILKSRKGTFTLRGQAERFRNFILKKLEKTSLQTNERAILQALVLGQKRDISSQLYKDYAAAGAVHILAVSGLHVGIIYIIILLLLRPLRDFKKGVYLQYSLLIILLWGFAFITGLSPSVTRAATMFSCFAFAKMINRESSTINNLFLSFFILLLWNPLLLFSVGFQLSYLAVFFIIWVHPKLNSYYNPRWKIDKMFWDIFTVSIAAQIGVLPLSLYYFHQFPGLFFITNIVVLPTLAILIGGGLSIIVLSLFNILPAWIVLLYNNAIEMLNTFIHWIANQDSFLFQNIHFTEEKVIGSYLFLICLIFCWKKFHSKNIILFLCSFSLLIGVFIYDKYKTSTSKLIIFHKIKHSILGNKHGSYIALLQSDTASAYKNTFPVKDFKIGENSEVSSEGSIPSIFKYNNKTILVIDSLGAYPWVREIDIVILIQSPKINLERLIDTLQPRIIIADGSNYTTYVNRWRKTCSIKKLPFRHTGKEGAFILE